METLSLEQFSPKKAELVQMAEEARLLVIAGPDDKIGYDRVHKKRMSLKAARVEITKTGEAIRANAIKFQKAVIEKEKELVAVIQPVEVELQRMQDAVDEEKEKRRRAKLLPERHEKLKTIGVAVEDEFLLVMDDSRFTEFFNTKHSEFLTEKERKIKEEKEIEEKRLREERERIEAEKRAFDLQKEREETERRHKEELEKTKIEAEAKAKRDAEESAEREKKRLADEMAAKEKTEREETERITRNRKYQDFLKKNGCDEKDSVNWIFKKTETGEIRLYKLIDSITL